MITDILAPLLVAGILVTALVRKTDITGAFCEGAKEGLKNAYELCPMLILLITAVTLFTSSGAAEVLSRFAGPLMEALGFPPECTPLIIMRPVSGSGSLAVLDGILSENDPDSFASRTASVMMCAAETTLYTISVLFASVKVKPRPGFFAASFIADITCFVFAPIFVRLVFGE